MRASAFEFRFRLVLHALIFVLGFWAPWNLLVPIDPPGPNAHVWGMLAANLSMVAFPSSVGGITSAFNLLLGLAILFAFCGALLRTWGAAYLGSAVVQDSAMHTADSPTPFAGPPAAGIVADGPYRHMRNPLYLGTFLHTFALALLMPRSGAVFAIVAIGIVQIRLILAEEAFLLASVGETYVAYCHMVPRIVPALRARVAAGGRKARWAQAFLGELYMWGVALSFAVLGWRYDAKLLLQAIVVSFGISLVVRALGARPLQKATQRG